MPSVITNTRGILKLRKVLSNSKCLVVMLKSTANDTEVTTRMTNNVAPNKPCRVITSLTPVIFKAINASPGVKKLNKAGIAITIENTGMNIHVLFKKYFMLILDKHVSVKHKI